MSVARGGRLPQALASVMQTLNASVDVDKRLWRQDIRGSIAHAEGLGRAGVLSPAEVESLTRGLGQISSEIESGAFHWDPVKEDVHMNIEARLIELLGDVGGKLHTARSRNDQVATDLRLWVRDAGARIQAALVHLGSTLTELAAREIDVLMPAYTHMQRAQPSRLSHHLMAWQELIRRDEARLADALRRLNECPLGAGAVAGTGFPLDREATSRALGFEHAMRNSIDATASRDFLMEVTAALAILGVHLSRIGEEIVLWSMHEIGFLALSDEFSTSSSMMPQKKNPDVAELVRGKAAVLVGCHTTLLVLEKSLSFGYGRDLQEDKKPIFEACDAALVAVQAIDGALATARFDVERLQGALGAGHVCATDLSDFLVTKGVPFRTAHHIVGGLVREAESRKVQLGALDESVLAAAHPTLADAEARAALDPRAAVERRRTLGGPAKEVVLAAIAAAEAHWAARQS
ncbi:MAG: argininosuccinate lyase [Polyangiaceae bacterium]